jgi:hypothetical protein
MTCAPIAVHGSASLRHAKGISGLSRAAVIASALRSGLYDEKIEARLQDDGSPRLLDLVPTVEESDGVELPLIRLRSVVPVDPDFEGLEAAAAIYDALDRECMGKTTAPVGFYTDMPFREVNNLANYAIKALTEQLEGIAT